MKNKATIGKEVLETSITKENIDDLKKKFSKDELLVTALGFGYCVLLLYKAAKLEIAEDFSPSKEAKRLARALRKQGRDSV